MPSSTREGWTLTEAHRRSQNNIAVRVLAEMLAIGGLLDVDDLDGSYGRWVVAAQAVIDRAGAESAATAANFYRLLRRMDLDLNDNFIPVLSRGLAAAQIQTSMLTTGPVAVKMDISRGRPPLVSLERGRVSSARAATRLALEPGRRTVEDSILADRRALGQVRVTSAGPCAFCAMLASRGPVYKDDSFDRSDARFTGSGKFKVHDGCGCQLRPVFDRGRDAWPEQSRQFADLWQESTRGESGKDAVNAFRRAISTPE